MTSKKFRWSKVYESSEEELTDMFQARGLQNTRLTGDAGAEQELDQGTKAATIWCAEGSLTITGAQKVSLQPGDALHLEDQTNYLLQAGISGFVCYLT